jgi:hypothetical protein
METIFSYEMDGWYGWAVWSLYRGGVFVCYFVKIYIMFFGGCVGNMNWRWWVVAVVRRGINTKEKDILFIPWMA